jgi:hypothetical protein
MLTEMICDSESWIEQEEVHTQWRTLKLTVLILWILP